MKIRKEKFVLAWVFFTLLSCKEEVKKEPIKESEKPNIVYILTDQWRSSAFGYAGNPDVKTPNLDAFEKTAVNFTNAVSVLPVCTPHRASLLTGKFPTTTGMFVNDLYLPSEELTMAEIYKAEGYNTAYWGKWHLDGHGRSAYIPKERRQGFEYWKALECSHDYNKMPYYDNDDTELKCWGEYSPFAIVEDANQYLAKHAKDAAPFLAVLSIATPHFPHHTAPQKYKDMYPPDSLTLNPNVTKKFEKRSREELQGYYAHATATDEAIGLLLKQIDSLNLSDNTIIVFSADHGEMMGAHDVRPFQKQLAWDESVRVPFLIKCPGINKQKGSLVNAPINTPDILPSLLSLSNIKIPEGIEGEDLSELMKNPDPNADRAALVMNVAPFAGSYKNPPYRAIRTKQYTYSKTPDGPNMFFDNISDPYQQNNLLGKPKFKKLQQKLDSTLNAKLTQIGDEIKSRDYYLNKYNYKFDVKKPAIPYWEFDNGKGVVQSPKPVLE
ncbi:sulfatase [Maribacter sp. TH_r10]|uniref:sulfatase family protein n=1 Tax=Maribacter sp. TH_r10 TaxID=3082086 RepID=UPI0029536979|nr:sulfatase [Maribacter sp. TH_r10]MDV7139078.1 sulfatase [Maribacter sp. TH_r10]